MAAKMSKVTPNGRQGLTSAKATMSLPPRLRWVCPQIFLSFLPFNVPTPRFSQISFCTNISKSSIFVQTSPPGVLHFPISKCNCNSKTTCLKHVQQFYFRRCWHKRVFIHLTFKLHDCVKFWSTDCWVVTLGMPHKKALASRVSLGLTIFFLKCPICWILQ